MKKDMDPKRWGEEYLIDIIKSDDPKYLRTLLFETMVCIGVLYKRMQLQVLSLERI